MVMGWQPNLEPTAFRLKKALLPALQHSEVLVKGTEIRYGGFKGGVGYHFRELHHLRHATFSGADSESAKQ